MIWLAPSTVALACLGGCLPIYEPRDLSARESRLEAEYGGGIDYREVQSDALDGMTFPILMSVAGQEPVTSELTFAHGKLDSALCRGQPGFSSVPYEAHGGEDASIHFTCDTTSGEVTTRWSGTVKNDKIAGTVETTRPGQGPVVRTFLSALEDAPDED